MGKSARTFAMRHHNADALIVGMNCFYSKKTYKDTCYVGKDACFPENYKFRGRFTNTRIPGSAGSEV
jgi:hypothetical protein